MTSKKVRAEKALINVASRVLTQAVVLVYGVRDQKPEIVSRLTAIKNRTQLLREVKFLGRVLKSVAPKSATDIKGIMDLRPNLVAKLNESTTETLKSKKKKSVRSEAKTEDKSS